MRFLWKIIVCWLFSGSAGAQMDSTAFVYKNLLKVGAAAFSPRQVHVALEYRVSADQAIEFRAGGAWENPIPGLFEGSLINSYTVEKTDIFYPSQNTWDLSDPARLAYQSVLLPVVPERRQRTLFFLKTGLRTLFGKRSQRVSLFVQPSAAIAWYRFFTVNNREMLLATTTIESIDGIYPAETRRYKKIRVYEHYRNMETFSRLYWRLGMDLGLRWRISRRFVLEARAAPALNLPFNRTRTPQAPVERDYLLAIEAHAGYYLDGLFKRQKKAQKTLKIPMIYTL